jgi:hypothetical protein
MKSQKSLQRKRPKAYESYKKYNGKDGAQEIVLEATKLKFVAVFARIGRKLVSASLL